jgi:hypothetical protein
VRHLYRALTEKVLRTGADVAFTYRCDGPETRREMYMRLSREHETVRYESSVLRETVRERELPRPTPTTSTFVAMCSICQNYRFPLLSGTGRNWNCFYKRPTCRRISSSPTASATPATRSLSKNSSQPARDLSTEARTRARSGQEWFDHLACYIREPEVAALEAEREFRVVQA